MKNNNNAHSERMYILDVLLEKRAFYLGVLKEAQARKYKDVVVESALEDTISNIADEISNCIWEDFEECLPAMTCDENFDELYETFISDKGELVCNINSYEKYGSRLLYPVPISFIEEILDELMLDFEWIYRPQEGDNNSDSMININYAEGRMVNDN